MPQMGQHGLDVAQVGRLGQPWRTQLASSAHSLEFTPPTAPRLSDFSLADASDLQGRQLLASLDKVASDLDRQEKAITGILRPPLEQGRAVQDSAERAKDLKVPPQPRPKARLGPGSLGPLLKLSSPQRCWCSMGTTCHV